MANRRVPPDVSYYPPDNVCQLLGQHLAEGLSFSSFAGVLGISRPTLNALLDRVPELKSTRAIGEAKALLYYERLRLEVLLGREDVKTNLLMFTLHTRFPEEYPRENEAIPIDQYEFAEEVAEQLRFLSTE